MVEAATAAAVQRPSGPSATRTWPRRPVQVAVPKKKVKEDKYEAAQHQNSFFSFFTRLRRDHILEVEVFVFTSPQ